ncbi:DNA/RNA helicase (DEAD/DEAH box family) [Renibacterium salmoninarum ATCC 33209]|uniref:DNA/RNA helicase (DEAD/DEAH box family) n=2 Tax=Renibacterium salmoninarum TaxID=1646 RepID=A9WMA9_RENSM|nr:DNA/RNA helicase (DEAD/DEAH box family) [Renibacterium salmoninarum ATCC 33209]
MCPLNGSFLLEIMAAAGLIVLDADTSHWLISAQWNAAKPWGRSPRQEQWRQLAEAWLNLDRAPSLIGQPVPGGAGSINPLAAESRRAEMPALRRVLISLMTQLGAEVADAEALAACARWHRPRLWRRMGRLAPGVLAEAELMGITGSGALTDFGAQLLQDGAAAEALLARASPKPVSTVLLQADLTAIAPGFLEPSLADELTLLAEREGHGPTVTFRFSAASIRNALDAGRGPEQILTFLRQHSSTELPQPLEYLIRDTAARHGLLRVASVSSVVSAADETLLLA